MFSFTMCRTNLLFSRVASDQVLPKTLKQRLFTIPSAVMLDVQNTPKSSSSNHLKNYALFYLGSLAHKRKIFCSIVSAAGSLGMHLWSVPVPLSSFGERTGTQPLNGILGKIWSPHWGHPRKKWKTGWPWEAFMESRGVPCTHTLRTLMPERSMM